MADQPNYYSLLDRLIDKGMTGIDGKFGIAYTCTNRRWSAFGMQSVLLYGWGIPWLTETFAQATAFLPNVENSVKENFTGLRVVTAKKAWLIIKEMVEATTGRLRAIGEDGCRRYELADAAAKTFEQWIQTMAECRMADKKRKELYRQAAWKHSQEKAEADRVNAHQTKVKFRKPDVSA